jgi:hypothetical protein
MMNSNENNNKNHNSTNISIICIQILTLFDKTDECMDKLECGANSII